MVADKGAESGRIERAPLEACFKCLFINSPVWKRECRACSSPRNCFWREGVWKSGPVWQARKRHERRATKKLAL